MTSAVIVYLLKNNQVALGRKKRGHGVDKWNGYGGKMKDRETSEEAAARELFEESGVTVKVSNLTKVAEIDYIEEPKNWHVDIFTATDFDGEPQPTEEMEPKWFKLTAIPYKEMWSNDKLWLEKVFAGENFRATFWHDDKGNILKYTFKPL